VTTVGRGGPIRARIAASLLACAGRADVEVCVGEERPILRGEDRFNWFDHEERCIAPGGLSPISDEPAPARIVRAAREVPGLELVAVGPMTNLARALALDPELPGRVARLTLMGGHVREARIGARVCAPGIDYNLCSDPEASVAVLGAGFPTTLVTADVTLQTWMTQRGLGRLDAGGPVARLLAEQVRLWRPVQRRIFTEYFGGTLAPDNCAFLHDPLTVLALFDESALRFEPLRIVATIDQGTLRTLESGPGAGIGAAMRVATAVDGAAAATRIVEHLVRI
jgi:purine nucleosidase